MPYQNGASGGYFQIRWLLSEANLVGPGDLKQAPTQRWDVADMVADTSPYPSPYPPRSHDVLLKAWFFGLFFLHVILFLSYLPNSTLSLPRHSIFHRICQIFLSIEHVILSSIVPALFSFFPNTSFLSSNVSASRTLYRLSFYISLDKHITYEQQTLIFSLSNLFICQFSLNKTRELYLV
jgi:hypothetical protein